MFHLTIGHSTSVTSFNDDGLSSNRTAYAQLTIQSGLELNVFGILTVNATRTHSNTVYMGFTDFNNYSQINIEEAAAIVVYGTLNVIGYITGEGKVEAKSESNILETLFIKSFRGGTITSGVYGKVFPFNQYTANNIESKLIINVGAIYKAATAVTVSIMGLQTGNIPLVGNTNGYLLNLKDGQIIKTYNTLDGTVELDVQGHADFNPITVSLSVTASSANKELPFDGTWNFKVSEGSTLTIKNGAWIGFLPGSKVEVESGASIIIDSGAKISVLPPNSIGDPSKYPNSFSNTYRTNPTVGFTKDSLSEIVINGKVIVKNGGTIAGQFELGEHGELVLEPNAHTYNNYEYITGNGGDNIDFMIISPYLGNTTFTKSINDSGEDVVIIRETLTDYQGNPIVGIQIDFTSIIGDFSIITNKWILRWISYTIRRQHRYFSTTVNYD